MGNPSNPISPLNPANPASPLNPMNQEEWNANTNTDITSHDLLYALLIVGAILAAIVLITIVISAISNK